MYGITKEIRKNTLKKIERQKKYLSSNYFNVGSDNIPMIELVKTPFINSNRYIAEINHRVYSLYHYAQSKNLVPFFGTITLPSEYHKFKKLRNGKIVKNRKYAKMNEIPKKYRIYDIKTKKQTLLCDDYVDYLPNAGAKQLSKMFKKILDSRLYRAIPKDDKCYFRVYEPHFDGTPHLHFMMFVPSSSLNAILKSLKKTFLKKYNSPYILDLKTNIKSPISYLMKYILKTFDDLRVKNDVTDLSIWYIANRITRFYTSRTLISLDVYRKLNGKYNLLELTQMYKDNELCVLLDIDTNKVVSIYDQYGNIYNKSLISIENNKKPIKLKYKKKEVIKNDLDDKIPVYMDNQVFYHSNGVLMPSQRFESFNSLSDLSLSDYYHFLDDNFDMVDNLQHFGLVHNEMVQRELLRCDNLILNDAFF